MQNRLVKLRRLASTHSGRRFHTRRALTLERLEERCLLASGYLQTNLVSDQAGAALITNPDLVNSWGIAFDPMGNFWVADQAKGVSTLYNGDVNGSPYVRDPAVISLPGVLPTGVVFNPTSDFVVQGGIPSGPAQFILASVTGNIDAFSPAVSTYFGTSTAQTVISTPNAIYTGLALANNGAGNFLYAANFRTGKIDVFDKTFAPTMLSGSFTDSMLPAGFAPFNIQNLGGKLYVAYAKQNPVTFRDVPGPGNGFVDVFDANGHLLQRLVVGMPGNPSSPLNSPWGLAIAPANFGDFSDDLLVGNFGDGRISAFNPTTGAFLGQISDATGSLLTIPGLWGLTFGNGVSAGNTNTLYFASGPGGEQHGLLGSLQSAQNKTVAATGAVLAAIEGTTMSGVVAAFGSANASALAGQFNATIAWGDGSTSAGVVTATGNGGFNVTGMHTYSDEGNFQLTITVTTGMTSSMTHTSAAVQEALLPDGTRGTANQRFVAEVYHDLLLRQVDAAGLSGWSSLLDQGASRAQIVSMIENTQEFRADEVQAVYGLLLRRSADPMALNNWTNFLSAGGTVEQMAAFVAGSMEYLSSRGGNSNDGFLTALYADALGRAVDPGSRVAWDNALSMGMSRSQVASLVFSSLEFRQDLVNGFYMRFLDRPADSTGLNGFASALSMGVRDEAAMAGIIGSEEFYNKTAP
jgi:uncharacterized protein (TIGR03118 family)